jgi:sulfur-carrier protein adenylyltransferase/sulfurtransferase
MARSDTMNRYARQIAVPQFGAACQARLRDAHVLVVGAGGLAAPLLPALIGAGAGHIRLVDPDVVDVSNLHRQTLFRMADIGQPKVEVAAGRLRGLNPDASIEPLQTALDPSNIGALAGGATLLLDCADSFAASYILSDFAMDTGVPLVSASVLGTSGYCGGFCGTAPSLRAVFPGLPPRLGSCADDGVVGTVVAVVGALQAQMALAVITGEVPSPLGQLVTFESRGLRFGGFRFAGAEEPDFRPRFIAGGEINEDDWVVDLREPQEAPLATPHALRLGVEDVGGIGTLPAKSQRAVLCCRSGARSWRAAERLASCWTGEIVLAALGQTDSKGNMQ